MEIRFRKFAIFTLVLVYLVIAAGAIVRMTGSGMGCPDWPKCFGYYIPPTEESELLWTPGKTYKKGMVIIREESLWVAKEDITTGSTYDPTHWESYTKHDYAVFNAAHTWVEYINRLLGALAGLSTLILAIWSVRLRKQNLLIPVFAWLVVLGMAFQAWLGATVVYSVLAPVRITLHMLMALLIVGLLLAVIWYTRNTHGNTIKRKLPGFAKGIVVALILTLLQVVLGTQVRQNVDEQVRALGEGGHLSWLDDPGVTFYIHRSFSIAVLLLNGYLFWINRKYLLGFSKINWVMALLGVEISTGILMYYLDFPFGSQPLHLLIASVLFAVQCYLVLELKGATSSAKSL